MKTIITNVDNLRIPPSTKNFSIDGDPKLACTCGNELCDRRAIKQWVLNKVQLMRDDANRPFQINSGGRCIHHPNEIKRVAAGRQGDHQKCVVVDIKINGIAEAAELATLAGRYGATAVAISLELGFIHCAWRELLKNDWRVRVWSY